MTPHVRAAGRAEATGREAGLCFSDTNTSHRASLTNSEEAGSAGSLSFPGLLWVLKPAAEPGGGGSWLSRHGEGRLEGEG